MLAIKHGGKRVGAGRKKAPSRQFKDAIQDINVSEIVQSLTEWAKGKSVICPKCGEDTLCYTADTVALQSAIELLNRSLGKSVQKSISLTANIQLTGDDCDELFERYQIANRALLGTGEILDTVSEEC